MTSIKKKIVHNHCEISTQYQYTNILPKFHITKSQDSLYYKESIEKSEKFRNVN